MRRKNTSSFFLAVLIFTLSACSDDGGVLDTGPSEAGLDKGADLAPDLGADLGPDLAPDLGVDLAIPDKGPDLYFSPDAVPQVPGSKCAAPVAVKLTPGKATTLTGNTTNALNQFSQTIKCGTGYDFDGQQIYYKMTLQAGSIYKFVATPSNWDVALYLFADTTCTAATINTQCETAVIDAVGENMKETLYFAPSVTGTYILAVDSYSATKGGAFTLVIQDFKLTANSLCNKATKVVFTGTKVTVNGDTSKNVLNQFGTKVSCDGSSSLAGPQLYYTVNLTANKPYKFTLKPTFNAYMYIFPSASCGTSTKINTACQSKGASGATTGEVKLGSTQSFLFQPTTTGDYVLAVDSTSVTQSGSFTLDFEEAALPTNDLCTKPKPLTLMYGKATVADDSTLATSNVNLVSTNCTKTATIGPDLFYSVTVSAGKSYKVSVATDKSYDPALYVFTTCTSVAGTCVAGLDTGFAGETEMVKFTATSNATYLIGVDTRYKAGDAYSTGQFNLTVEEFIKPPNAVCSKPQNVTLTAGKATLTSDTFYASDEYSGLKCGSSLTFDGPQLYYRVSLAANQKYLATITPASTYDAALYAFPATTSCNQSAVEAACKGHVADRGSKGVAENLVISPTSSQSWDIVADSWDPKSYGTFTLQLEQLIKPAHDSCFNAKTLQFAPSSKKITETGHTYAATNTIGLAATGCSKNLTAAPEVFYKVTLQKNKAYKIRLDGAGYNEALYLFSSCSSAASTCVAGADLTTAGAEEILFSPTATLNYYIGVDGRGATDMGPFTLTVEEVISACDVVKNLTFNTSGVATTTGDTTGGSNTVNLTKTSCMSKTSPGYDKIYSVSLAASKTYTVTLTPGTSFDPMLYVFTTCTHPEKSCIKGIDTAGNGSKEIISITTTTAGTYYIAVDSTATTKAGTFTLEVK